MIFSFIPRSRFSFSLGVVLSVVVGVCCSAYESMADTMLQIPELSRPSVRIKNPENVKAKLKAFICGGREGLQVVADFDRTISKFKHEGHLVPTCYSVLDNSDLMPNSYKEKADMLYKYYVIEMSSGMKMEEKIPHMIEWWTQAHEMITTSGLTRDTLTIIINKAQLTLREGSTELFSSLRDHQVPLLIFSAGVGDVIDGVLSQRGELYDNMKIVSNFIDFDTKGSVTGFKGKLIHIYNKNEGAIHDSDYFKTLSSRKNVLLLGDSVGDLTMAAGVEGGNILKIGFLNEKIDERLETYMNAFDVVLTEDETMDIPNALLHAVFQEKNSCAIRGP